MNEWTDTSLRYSTATEECVSNDFFRHSLDDSPARLIIIIIIILLLLFLLMILLYIIIKYYLHLWQYGWEL